MDLSPGAAVAGRMRVYSMIRIISLANVIMSVGQLEHVYGPILGERVSYIL